MFLNYCILNIFDYICAQNAQCWARIIKSDMEIQRYNRLDRRSRLYWLRKKELAHGSLRRWATASVPFHDG